MLQGNSELSSSATELSSNSSATELSSDSSATELSSDSELLTSC